MEDGKTSENHLTSAAAFVEGGIQEACDDACSICLEDFSESDPSTVTSCKHEFHLQCVLEWCQRSSHCPMCWQAISLKDPGSQELLDAVEHERNLRMNPPRTTTIFRHPTLGDFELQHLPVSATESELEERIIQHLAAAAAMGRARQLARREGQRNRSATQGRPHMLVFSTNPNSSTALAAPSIDHQDGNNPPQPVMVTGPNSSFIHTGEDSVQYITRPSFGQADSPMTSASGSSTDVNQHNTSLRNGSPSQISPGNQDRAGSSSDFQSFSESVKSHVSAWSTRYKESITRSTRSWKEKLFNRSNPIPAPDPSAEIRRDDQTASMSRLMDHLNLADNKRTSIATASSSTMANSNEDGSEQHNALGTDGNPSLNEHSLQSSISSSSPAN